MTDRGGIANDLGSQFSLDAGGSICCDPLLNAFKQRSPAVTFCPSELFEFINVERHLTNDYHRFTISVCERFASKLVPNSRSYVPSLTMFRQAS